MKKFMKKFGFNFLRHRLNNRRGSPEEEKGFMAKNVDAGKEATKTMAKEAAKNAAKKAAKKVIKSKVAIGIGAILGNIIIFLICTVLILAPVSYTYMLFMGAFSDFNNATLQISTNFENAMKTWFKSNTSQEAIDEKATNYEQYLLNRFMHISDEALEKELESTEANELKQVAVSWVYGKIYNDYFKPGIGDEVYEFVFGGDSGQSEAPILKPIGQTATEIYTPGWGKNVEDVRKEVAGDSINLYDIEAFDYVAGSLFDLLDLDLEVARARLIEKNKKEIDAKTKKDKLDIYVKYGESILYDWTKTLYKYLDREDLDDYLATIGLNKNSLFKISKSYTLHDFHKFFKENYSYSSSESYKWLIDSLDELDSKGCKEKYSLEKVSKELIKSEKDYKSLLNISNELEYVFRKYVLSLAETSEQENKLSTKVDEITKKYTFLSVSEKYDKKANEELSKVENTVIKEFTEEELKNELLEMITELNLVRSQNAAISYKKYLTELETVTTVEYYTINLNNEIFNELYKLPIYTVDFFNKSANSGEDIDKLVNSKDYYKDLDKYIQGGAAFVKERPSIFNKMFIDKGQINPIVSAIDSKTGVDYLAGNVSIVFSDLVNLVHESKQQLLEVQKVFQSAKNGDRDALLKLEAPYWNNIDEIFDTFTSNKFYDFYLGPGYNKEQSGDALNFKTDVYNRNTESNYWKGFVQAKSSWGSRKLKFSNVSFEEYVEPFRNSGMVPDFMLYYMGDSSGELGKYKPIFEDYNDLLNTFVENACRISILRQEPNIKGDGATYYSRVDSLIENEIKKLNTLQTKLESASKSTLENDPHGIFQKADLSEIHKAGKPIVHNNSDYINGNVLEIKKYKYTQEECIKLVATEHYPDVLAKYKSLSGVGGVGAVIDIGDLQLGTSTVPGGANYSSYQNAVKYLPLVEEIVKENGDLIDPYYLIAMMATESSGILRPVQAGETAAGLMQIENVHWGNTVTLPSGKSITLDPIKLGEDARLSIEAGLWEAYNSAQMFRGNLFMGVVGYNMGNYAMERIIFLTLVGEGKAQMSDWAVRGTALGEGPNGRMEAFKLRPLINNYIDSGSLSWLNYRAQYQQENWFGGGVGTLNHLEKVLAFYNTAQGMPWYRPYKGADKIVIGGNGDASLGKDEDGNETYHKNNRLVLWEEYYTKNDTFKKLDKWAENKNKQEDKKNTKLVSKMVIDAIKNIDTTLKNELSGIDISNQDFKAILAGTLNVGTSVHIPGDKSYSIVVEPGFKMTPRTKKDIDALVKQVALEYIELYKGLNGKDKDFALYLYVANDRELAKLEIANETGTFVDFVKNKYAEEAESFTSVNPDFIKVAQIITGDLGVNVKDFYSIVETVDSGSENITIINPIDQFYQEWLEGKYIMHEMYNVMIEQTNEKRVNDGKEPYPLLPTLEEVMSNQPSEYESDIEGTLTVKGPNGETYSVVIKKNFLTEITSKAIGNIQHIVIHDTGDSGSGGKATKQYEKMNKKDATETMHYVIGSDEVYHFVQDNTVANHISDSGTATGGTRPEITNSNSLGIQFEANSTRNKDKVFWHTVAITKYLMDKNPAVTIDNVVLHNDVTGIDDSAIMLKNNKEEWNKFKDALKNSTVTFTPNTGNLAGIQYKLVATARSLLGQPYVYGAAGEIVTDSLIENLRSQFGEGEGEYAKTDRKFFDGTYRGFDCSSFVQYVYKENGVNISRTTYSQIEEGKDVFKTGEKINESKLLPGDLLFSPGHVIMWIGNGEYIHAPKPGDVIKIGKGIPSNVTRVKRIVESKGKFEFYSQHDSRWASYPYSTDNVSGSGCGPTSTAMVLSGLNHNGSKKIDTNKDGKITPNELAAYSTKQGTVGADGTYFSFYSKVGAELGVPVREIIVGSKSDSAILQELKTELKAGKGIVASYTTGHWISGGHLIALVGVSSDNKIIVHDPNINTYEGTLSGDRYNGPNPDNYIVGPGTGALRFFVFG